MNRTDCLKLLVNASPLTLRATSIQGKTALQEAKALNKHANVVLFLERETQKPLEELVLSHTVFGSLSVPELIGVLEVHETWHHEDLAKLLPTA